MSCKKPNKHLNLMMRNLPKIIAKVEQEMAKEKQETRSRESAVKAGDITFTPFEKEFKEIS